MQNPGEMHFERRGREGFAEVAKENQKGFSASSASGFFLFKPAAYAMPDDA